MGSASPRIVAELAARHTDSAVPADPAALAEYFDFRDFAHFIQVYLSVVDLIRDAEDVRLLTFEVARDMARQHIRYAELTVTPFSSTRRGIPEQAFMEAIEDARKAAESELGVMLRWCFDIPGEAGLTAAEETVRLALDLRPDGLVSFGLGGPEIGVPRPQFKPFFDRARAEGLHSVPHAGETTGPQTVWDAIHELGAERIGHGTSSAQDPRLLDHLAEHRIPLEVCPTSNIATRAVATLDEHPIRQMVDAGVLVTVNSDDPPMFGTDLNTEYAVAARLLDLDAPGSPTWPRTPSRVLPGRGGQGPARRRDRLLHRCLELTPVTPRPVTAVAHRGDPYHERENTLASVRSALRKGADAVEVDVRLTLDGVPVLLHDRTLDRLWRHPAPVATLTADELSKATDGGVPTFADALDELLGHGGRSRMLLDIADTAGIAPVMAAVREAGADDRVYYCGAMAAMHEVRAMDAAAEIALTWTTSLRPAESLLTGLAPRWINLRFPLVDPATITWARERGLLVAAWTADWNRSMSRLLAAGVDAITTNRLDALQRLLDKRR